MNIDIIKLRSNIVDQVEINFNYSFNETELNDSGLLELNDMSVTGKIAKGYVDEYILTLKLEGTMYLPCSICLKKVEHPFCITIEDSYSDLIEDIDKNIKNSENTIDIFPIIWENILLEIPTHLTHKECESVKLSGDGWSFKEKKDSVNPELEKLKDLL